MGLEVQKGFFKSRGDVLADIERNGYWPWTFVSGPSPGLDVHWHSHDVHGYVMEGRTSFLDVESGKRLAVEPGDKVIVPARALHAEGEVVDRVVYILAAPEPMGSDEFLQLLPPEDL